MVEKRKRNPNVPRAEAYGLRLDPKSKYLAEIAARRQRRSLASFIEWAMEQATKTVPLDDSNPSVTAYSCSDRLWDIEEADRLVKLVWEFPDLLNYEEQLIWRIVDQYRVLVHGGGQKQWLSFQDRVSSKDRRHNHNIAFVRRCWPEIKRYALEGEGKEALDAAMIKQNNELNGMDYQPIKK